MRQEIASSPGDKPVSGGVYLDLLALGGLFLRASTREGLLWDLWDGLADEVFKAIGSFQTRGRPKNSLCIHICRRERVGRLGRTLAISMCALGGIVLVVAFIIMLEPGVEQQSFSMGWFLAR
jgi:hypothetical protein